MKQQISRRPEKSRRGSLSNSRLTGSITRYPTLSTSDPNFGASADPVCTPARRGIPSANGPKSPRRSAEPTLRQTCRRFCERSGALLLRSLARTGGSAVNGTGAAALRSSGAHSERERRADEGKYRRENTHLDGRRAASGQAARRPLHQLADDALQLPISADIVLQMGQRRSADERAPIRGEATHSVRRCSLRSLRWRTAQSHLRRRSHVTTSALG